VGDGAGHTRVVAPMRSPWRGLTVPPIARPAILARAIWLNRLPGLAAKASGAAPRPVAGNAGNATAASLIAGADVVQPGGTDNAPTEAAWPRPAEPADPLAPNWSNRLII
jgi:hypothetical protein